MSKFRKNSPTPNKSSQIDASNCPDLFSDVDSVRLDNAYAAQSQPGPGKKRNRSEPRLKQSQGSSCFPQYDPTSELYEYVSSNSDDSTEVSPNSASDAPSSSSPRKLEPDTAPNEQPTSVCDQEELLLNVDNVAKLLNCSISTVWRRQKQDPEFPVPVKFGGSTKWLWSEIRQYIELLKSKRTMSRLRASQEG